MPNLTVSGNVDTMLGAADNAAIRSAIGVGQTDAPTLAGLGIQSQTDGAHTFRVRNIAGADLITINTSTRNVTLAGDAFNFSTTAGNLTSYNLGGIAWSDSSTSTGGTLDLFIRRDSPGILAQRNVAVAQALRVYNSTDATPATNYDRGVFDFKTTTNTLRIGTENGGTYTLARPIEFVTGGVVRMSISGGGDTVLSASFTAAGIINTGNRTLWSGKTAMSAPTDGVLRVTNNASSGFTSLELGEADMGIMRGTGTPEGVVTGKVGSIFLRLDGGASTTLYVKQSGTGNTGWVAK